VEFPISYVADVIHHLGIHEGKVYAIRAVAERVFAIVRSGINAAVDVWNS
jgi:hypothetical protein